MFTSGTDLSFLGNEQNLADTYSEYEKIFLEWFETVPELLSGLKEYFQFYNFDRPHQSLLGNTPAEIYWGREVAKKVA